MDALSLHSKILDGYKDYIRSFIDIHDEDIRVEVEKALETRKLWPEPLVQFNPSFEKNGSVDALVNDGVLDPEVAKVFKEYSPPARRKARASGATSLVSNAGLEPGCGILVSLLDGLDSTFWAIWRRCRTNEIR